MESRSRGPMTGATVRSMSRAIVLGTLCCWGLVGVGRAAPAWGQEAQWIWAPGHSKEQMPRGTCYFRKLLNIRAVEQAEITIAADDAYELYVNGRRIGSGQSAKRLDQFDLTERLGRGRNVIAVKATNRNGLTAALAARLMVKERGGDWRSFSSDASWLTNERPLPFWNTALYNDSQWSAAQVFGKLGDTVPWDREEGVAVEARHDSERFTIAEEFEVQRVLDGEATGSLIAMAFNEFGHIIASREGGPLLLIYDSDKNQIADKVRVYCEEVKSCQGILALNGEVYVTGDGPDGQALYRLSDEDRDGSLEKVRAIVKFRGELGEHSAHGLTLGPDGLIYVMLGNHTTVDGLTDPDSPYRNPYEGDLVHPRYEDPGGHAVGIKAPGGVILRTDTEGSAIEVVAGGLRNSYDLMFNREGDLFAHDSDMEADVAASWYRPTQLFHIIPGAEYGWRSGWATWPGYFVDAVPALLDTGRGSPTGGVVYDHVMFPARFHNALFLADWSEGRILAVQLQKQGSTYTAHSEVFLQGQPLNVTDLEVGPDGWLYFVTGGRGTEGGVYRVTWQGAVPKSVTTYPTEIAEVIRLPQFHSAWGRQRIAKLKKQLGDEWDPQVLGVALAAGNSAAYRMRALDVMQLFGPAPTSDVLVKLAQDKNEQVRAKAAELMGLHANEATGAQLVLLLGDSDRTVRRKACEALVRCGQTAPLKSLQPMLASDDRLEAWAARRLLERLPLDTWKDELLGSETHRLVIQGGLALLIAEPTSEHAQEVIARVRKVTAGFVSDRDFIDLLRLVQVALERGELVPGDVPELGKALADEFPAGNALLNRELVRILAYLQVDAIIDRYLEYLDSDVEEEEKLHLAMHLRFIETGWTPEQRLKLLGFYEQLQQRKSGSSVPLYVMHATRDFCRQLNAEEAVAVMERGAEWPNAALGALYRLPRQLDDATRKTLAQLDQRLADADTDAATRLKVGIVAVLARSGDSDSLVLLREIWERDPKRRQQTALGLAQFPVADNWEFLVRSFPQLEADVAREIIGRLLTCEIIPDDPDQYRQLILLGLRYPEQVGHDAMTLLEHWAAETPVEGEQPLTEALAAWQAWFSENFPDLPDAKLPQDREEAKWKFAELLEYVQGDEAQNASATNGATVFQKAQCNKCHRFGDAGEGMGPDLTAIFQRFTVKEIVESICFPSHVISNQYAAKNLVLTDGRTVSGIVGPGAEGELMVLQSNGEKRVVNTEDVEETLPSKISAMPEGLLDPLTIQEIADLMAYLKSSPARGVTRRTVSD